MHKAEYTSHIWAIALRVIQWIELLRVGQERQRPKKRHIIQRIRAVAKELGILYENDIDRPSNRGVACITGGAISVVGRRGEAGRV